MIPELKISENIERKSIRLGGHSIQIFMLSQTKQNNLFVESKSGELHVPNKELENHLRMTYLDDLNGNHTPHLRDLPKPQDPTVMFNNSGIKLKEVRDFFHMIRAGSVPGINVISYKLYRNCPCVFRKLTVLLRHVWKKGIVPQEWIPTEMQTKGITNFCPIILLNVEGEIFFGVLVCRMTKFLMSNYYIITSV